MDWAPFYPEKVKAGEQVKVAYCDVGCGYGGLTSNHFVSRSSISAS